MGASTLIRVADNRRMSYDPVHRNLPALRPGAGTPRRGFATAGSPPRTFRGLPVPWRLARLVTVLAFASLVLVCGGIGGWAALGSELVRAGKTPSPLDLPADSSILRKVGRSRIR